MNDDEIRSGGHRCLWLTKGLGRGGVERLMVDMLPLVDDRRFEIDVAYLLPWKDAFHRELEDLGAQVFCLGSRHGTKDARWVARLGQLLRHGRYDVVHTHAPVPAVAARLMRGRSWAPEIVHTEHNVWDRYRIPTRLANALTYRRNSAVIAVSGVVSDSIRPWPRIPMSIIRTVHHGINLGSVRTYGAAERDSLRRDLDLPPDRFLIGNVGNFTPKKDHRTLLAALAGDGPIADAHLVLIGLGPLEPELRSTAKELGVDQRVTFLGSRTDVFDLLPMFDVFCLSSEFEGFPIALVEAMASGLPCVATAAGGIPEAITDGETGLLVPPKDPAALRAAIERIMSDVDLRIRLSELGGRRAEALDLRRAVDELQQVYDEVLRGAR